jgi:ATP/ADP translocase
MRKRLEGLFNTVFKIRPHEAGRALLLFAYLLAAVGAFIMGRNVRDTLFLSHFNRDVLVYMYITQAAVVALPAWFYAKYTNAFRRDRLIQGTLVVMVAVTLVAYPLVLTRQPWVYVALYNWVELVGAIMMIQFWTFAGDVFSSREAKRAFPFIGGGGVLANIVMGALILAAVKYLGVASLLLAMAVLLGVCFLCVTMLGRAENGRLQEQANDRRKFDRGGQRLKMGASARGVFESTHLKIIAGMTCITFVAVQFVDFQFKSVTREVFKGDELAQFYAYFTMGTGVLAALVQFGLSARLLERFGVVVGLLFLPALLLCGNLWVALASAGLASVTFTQGAQVSLRYSIYDATVQVIYTPVPADKRGRAKTFIDGILKPGAIAFAGVLMWFLGNKLKLKPDSLAWAEVVLVLAWLALVLSIKREYVRELLATLRRRRLQFDGVGFSITDAPTIQVLRRTLGSSEPREVRNTLELLPRVQGATFSAELRLLLCHDAADIRARAVTLLGSSGAYEHAEAIAGSFGDPSEPVRAAAIRAFCFLGRESAISTVQPYLADPSAPVRAAAVAGLIGYGGLDGMLRAAEHLQAMLHHPDEAHRDHAAQILAEIHVRNFYQPVLDMLRDPSPKVQLSALAAAGEMQSPELLPALVYRLARRHTAAAAARALSRYGEKALPALGKVLAHPDEDLAVRRQVPRVVALIGGPAALDLLLGHVGTRDPALRREVARAAVRVRDRLPGVTVPVERVEPAVESEVREAFELLAAVEDLGPRPDRPSLLHDALNERVQWTVDRAFKLLAVVYPSKTVELVFGNISSASPNVRANAVEVLDNMLSKRIARFLLPLVEDAPAESKLRRGGELFVLTHHDAESRLRDLMNGPDPWLRVCAVHEAGERGMATLVADVTARLGDADPVVRETTARALTRLLPRDTWLGYLERLRDDRVERLRRYAEGLAASTAPGGPTVTGA